MSSCYCFLEDRCFSPLPHHGTKQGSRCAPRPLSLFFHSKHQGKSHSHRSVSTHLPVFASPGWVTTATQTHCEQQSGGVCRNTSHLHPFSGKEKEEDSILQQGRLTENHHPCSGCQIRPAFPSSLHVAPHNHVPYQGIDIFHLHGPTVEDVSAQHNEEEEETQQRVAHIAEDVVESTAGKKKV